MITNISKGRIVHKVKRDDLTYELEPLIILKYNIATGKSYTDKDWLDIINENKYYYYDRIGLQRLKRLMTKSELSAYLIEKDAPANIVSQLIEKYVTYGYLNDTNYAKLYVEQRKLKEGPNVITNKLKKKGINIETINLAINETDQDEIVRGLVLDLIAKNKTKTKIELENTIKRSLISKGYNYEIINDNVTRHIGMYNLDEYSMLVRDYTNQVKRRISGQDTEKFKQKLLNKFYRKGYKIEDIKSLESKHFKDS